MAAVILNALFGKKKETPKPATWPIPNFDWRSAVQAYASPVFVPQQDQGANPSNLPLHQPIYAHPETDPESANDMLWHPEQPLTGTFLDQFQEQTIDNVATIRNSNMPDGLLPHFKEGDIGLRYIPAQDPYEFKPPKTELLQEELRGNSFARQNNVHGNLDLSTLYGKRYAELNQKGNGPLGALDNYSLWDTDAGNVPSKMERELGLAELTANVDVARRGWGGAKEVTERFEGFHPRTRIFPYKESFMSLRPEIKSRPGIPYLGVAASYNPSLGLLQLPDNEDVTNYTRDMLPTEAQASQREARIMNVPLRRTERTTVQYPYTGAPGTVAWSQEALRPSCINTIPKNMTNTHVMGAGALAADAIADVQACNAEGMLTGRVNNNEPKATLKGYTTITAGAQGYWPQRDATSQAVQYWPDFPGAAVRRVTPDIRMDIDPSLIQAYTSNPYTPAITNMPYPYGVCGETPSTQFQPASLPSAGAGCNAFPVEPLAQLPPYAAVAV